MKFSCDSCGAQYMISDDKVGPNGVKVRCKKCSNIVVVKRPPAAVPEAPQAAAPAPAPAAAAAPRKELGLEEELGNAFDAAFGGPPEAAADKEKGGGDMAATQLMSQDEIAKLAAQPPAKDGVQANGATAPAESDWYVAIRDAQVGPLGTAAVKEKWESGEIGPETLVWKPGMADWGPLSGVAELAQVLAPIPRHGAVPKIERAKPGEAKAESKPAEANGVSHDPEWKPSAASALAALANEELSSMAAPAPARKAPSAVPAAGGSRSLVDSMNLPDGGVDPTGAIPLNIKGLEQTDEKALKRKSSVARDAEAHMRRSTIRTAVVLVLAVVVVFAALGAGFMYYISKKIEPIANNAQPAAPGTLVAQAAKPAPAVAPAPAPQPPPPPAAAPAPAPAPAQPVAAAPPPAPAPAPAPAAQPPAPAPQPVAAAPRPPPPAPRARAERAERVEKPEPPVKHKREARVAALERPGGESPAPSRKKASNDPLDFDSGSADSDFEKELNGGGGGGGSGKHVYIPPAAGSDIADSVTNSQITEAVAGKISSLRRCISEQKAADPDLKGVLKMRWGIRPDGGVQNVRCLSDEFSSQPFAKCIAGVVKSIRFPKTKSGNDAVDFPFNF